MGRFRGWEAQAPTNSPNQLGFGLLAFHEASGKIVYFGGDHNFAFHIFIDASDDTWTWDGTDWTLESPVDRPVGLADFPIGYDPVREVVVVRSGVRRPDVVETGYPYFNYNHTDFTWEWDGTNWTQIDTTATVIDPLPYASMAFHVPSGKMVMTGGIKTGYGGFAAITYNDDTTWTYDGTTWTVEGNANNPLAQYGANLPMWYDPISTNVLCIDRDNVFWAWDGSEWNNITPAVMPPYTYSSAGSYHPNFGESVLFTGSDSLTIFQTAWGWDQVQWTEYPYVGFYNIGFPTQFSYYVVAIDTNGDVLSFGDGDYFGSLTKIYKWIYVPSVGQIYRRP